MLPTPIRSKQNALNVLARTYNEVVALLRANFDELDPIYAPVVHEYFRNNLDFWVASDIKAINTAINMLVDAYKALDNIKTDEEFLAFTLNIPNIIEYAGATAVIPSVIGSSEGHFTRLDEVVDVVLGFEPTEMSPDILLSGRSLPTSFFGLETLIPGTAGVTPASFSSVGSVSATPAPQTPASSRALIEPIMTGEHLGLVVGPSASNGLFRLYNDMVAPKAVSLSTGEFKREIGCTRLDLLDENSGNRSESSSSKSGDETWNPALRRNG